MKFFKNLAIWWGWMFDKHPLISALVPVISFISLISVSLIAITDKHFLSAAITFVCASIIFALEFFGLKYVSPSRNWRVAVAEAEKMKKDPRYADKNGLLDGFIDLAKKRERGHDLTEIIDFLKEREALRVQILSLLEEQQNTYRKRTRLEEKLTQLNAIIDGL